MWCRRSVLPCRHATQPWLAYVDAVGRTGGHRHLDRMLTTNVRSKKESSCHDPRNSAAPDVRSCSSATRRIRAVVGSARGRHVSGRTHAERRIQNQARSACRRRLGGKLYNARKEQSSAVRPGVRSSLLACHRAGGAHTAVLRAHRRASGGHARGRACPRARDSRRSHRTAAAAPSPAATARHGPLALPPTAANAK